MTSPENFGQQFVCPDCGGWMELNHQHISPFEHLYNGNLNAFRNAFDNLARAQRAERGRRLVEKGRREWDASRTRVVDLSNHADLLAHLTETAGHQTGWTADASMHGSWGHLQDHAPLEKLGIKEPTTEEDWYKPLALEHLQKVHDYLHQHEGTPHVTEGNQHFHTDLGTPRSVLDH